MPDVKHSGEYNGTGPHYWPAQDVYCRYFRPDSSVDNWGDPSRIQGDFLLRLDEARELAGVPFIINSGWRDDRDSAHGFGWAADIKQDNGRMCWEIVEDGLKEAGFNRIGVYTLHIHVDADPQRPPNVMWGGKSQ